MSPSLRTLFRAVCPLGLALLAGAGPAWAEVAREYQIKAAFLYNFTKFVEWPPARAAEIQRPILIGILGRDPFGGELAKIIRDRKVDGRELSLRIVRSATEAAKADLLFVGAGEEEAWVAMRDALQRAGVLTVGESASFLAAGGVISFVIDKDKVRFAVNLDASERTRLKLSAQLLKLAIAVHKSPPVSAP